MAFPQDALSIPKLVSSRIDPHAPSLLDLPTEIRLEIFTQAFKRNEPILIFDASETYWGNYKTGFEQSLLSMCLVSRQIYHEVTPIVYGANTWVFPHPYHYPVRAEEKDLFDDHDGFQYTIRWLNARGTQSSLIKHIVYDIFAHCDESACHSKGSVDFLPLIQWWKRAGQTCNVAFACSGMRYRFFVPRWEDYLVEWFPRNPQHTAKFKAVFDRIARDGALGLERFDDCQLISVDVCFRLRRVFVFFEGPENGTVHEQFEIASHGTSFVGPM
jgi:hypothetical protein